MRRLFESKFELCSVLVSDDKREILHGFDLKDTPVYVVAQETMNQIVGFKFHRGVLAAGKRKDPTNLETYLSKRTGELSLCVCVQLENPDNLGTIIRTCSALGMDALLIAGGGPDPFSRRVIRVSMGESLYLPIFECEKTSFITLLHSHNIPLLAAISDPAALPIQRLQHQKRYALVLGKESAGLPADIVEGCDIKVTLPMRGAGDSLNVAVASGIFLYYLQEIANA